MTEHEAMSRALELAKKGWGRVAPNPMVGAVLLRDGVVVGEGFHAEYGHDHAEVAALNACDDPAGTTCVVNLEPCNHHGRTPPCSAALAGAGVTRVVYAVPDPHAAAAGGAEALRRAGVVTQRVGDERAAAALNAAFLWGVARPERPFVALKLAVTLDGFVADRDGRSQWVTGPAARTWVHELRAGFDAIAVGRGTAVADDPQLTVRGPIAPRTPPTRVVFARTGAIPVSLRLIATARDVPTVVVTAPDTPRGDLERAGVETVAEDTLEGALGSLKERGIGSILVEGGGAIAGALLDAGLVDRMYQVQAPRFFGEGVRAIAATQARSIDDALAWEVTDRVALGRDSLLVVDRELCLQES